MLKNDFARLLPSRLSLSVLELHQFSITLADFTADRELHPALKTYILTFIIILHFIFYCNSFFDKSAFCVYNSSTEVSALNLQRHPKENTCCFTGYRPNKLPWGSNEADERCIALKTKLYDIIDALYTAGIRHFICGMAQGADTYFCEQALKFRAEHDDITVEAAIPCEEQASKWSRSAKERYDRLIAECDYETLISKKYTPDCMLRRNNYMVECSSVLVAVYDGKFGGTMQTVRQAQKQEIEIIQIMP